MELELLFQSNCRAAPAEKPSDWAQATSACKRSVNEDNKEALIMAIGLMTTGQKIKNSV